MNDAAPTENNTEIVRNGDPVTVVDEHGVRHPGLVTQAWGTTTPFPAINVVFITTDPKKRDDYGSQKEHLCSTSHAKYQSAPGRYWYVDPKWARPTERDGVAALVEATRRLNEAMQ